MDRNLADEKISKMLDKSLSARRAWIEIVCLTVKHKKSLVALRKESVDRNSKDRLAPMIRDTVALRKESVDRNRQCTGILYLAPGRSPQGERG